MKTISAAELMIRKAITPGAIQRNPVTGGSFVRGVDSMPLQVEAAERALAARAHFGSRGPGGLPLPLSYEEREDLKLQGAIEGCPDKSIYALFGRSLEALNWDLHLHPAWPDYAAGFLALAHGHRDTLVEYDPSILDRYPPLHLRGLAESGYWRPEVNCSRRRPKQASVRHRT